MVGPLISLPSVPAPCSVQQILFVALVGRRCTRDRLLRLGRRGWIRREGIVTVYGNSKSNARTSHHSRQLKHM